MKRAAQILAVLAFAWIALLFVLGFVLAGSTASNVAKRLGDSLQGSAKIDSAHLGLVRGNFTFEHLAIRRDDVIGKLVLDVGEVECDLPPLGLALVNRTCGELVVTGMRLDVSTIALFGIQKQKRAPFRADHVTIDDAELVFSASAFLPSLGRVRIVLEHAEAGPTLFKTPLSFLFQLQSLRAAFELPAGITLRISYADGKMVAQGSVFGSTPLTIPLALPKLDSTDDAIAEIKKLVAWGKDLTERLVAARAESWIEKQLP